MADKSEVKPETLPDLDDLLQCPVCYEIPTKQIFQCNQGHHVCGRCKLRLVECPVCRDLFFGTRNYAMEELIANVRKLQAFKLGGKVTIGSVPESSSQAVDNAGDSENNTADDDDVNDNSSQSSSRAPPACKGLFRCLCCKNGKAERLPAARMLNHLRYYHSSLLIEGSSENGEYLQAWQFPTLPGRIVTAVRVSDMGIFFLIIEINDTSLCSWLAMLAAPWIAHEFSYTVTISGSDREAIFSDYVWSVRSCEGSLKKRGHCLLVNGADARALTTPNAISAKLNIRRTPADQLLQDTQPRAVLRVANRGTSNRRSDVNDIFPVVLRIRPDIDLHSPAYESSNNSIDLNNVIDQELIMAGHRNLPVTPQVDPIQRQMIDQYEFEELLRIARNNENNVSVNQAPSTIDNNQPTAAQSMSRNARRRRRIRERRALLNNEQAAPPNTEDNSNQAQRQTSQVTSNSRQNQVHQSSASLEVPVAFVGGISSVAEVVQPQPTSSSNNTSTQNQNSRRKNKKRRQRR